MLGRDDLHGCRPRGRSLGHTKGRKGRRRLLAGPRSVRRRGLHLHSERNPSPPSLLRVSAKAAKARHRRRPRGGHTKLRHTLQRREASCLLRGQSVCTSRETALLLLKFQLRPRRSLTAQTPEGVQPTKKGSLDAIVSKSRSCSGETKRRSKTTAVAPSQLPPDQQMSAGSASTPPRSEKNRPQVGFEGEISVQKCVNDGGSRMHTPERAASPLQRHTAGLHSAVLFELPQQSLEGGGRAHACCWRIIVRACSAPLSQSGFGGLKSWADGNAFVLYCSRRSLQLVAFSGSSV